MTAPKTQWDGRLGVEVAGKMKGCCVESMLDWKPLMIGQKLACRYCSGTMKTIRAGEMPHSFFTGTMGEFRKEEDAIEMMIGGLYFSAKRFETPEDVTRWTEKREIGKPETIEDINGHAFYIPIERLRPETIRAVYIAPGVIAEIGISEKNGPTGAGQATMQPPGITTTSLASGGMTHPDQGPAALRMGTSGMPPVLHGMTDPQDGHTHEFHLASIPDFNGFRVQGKTSFNNGHCHMIEAGLNPDGSLDTRTAPDQSPVGGHAHAHKIVHRSDAPAPIPVAPMDAFKEQLSAAIKKAKVRVAPAGKV